MDSRDLRAAAEAAAAALVAPGAPFELVEEDVLGARMPVFKNRARSLGQLVRESVAFGDRDYLVTADEQISFADHAVQVASLATALRDEHGVRPGDRVAIAAANSPEWVTAFWATAALGAVTAAFKAGGTGREVEYPIGHVTPRVVVADAKRAQLL